MPKKADIEQELEQTRETACNLESIVSLFKSCANLETINRL